jgi:putative membrane protein
MSAKQFDDQEDFHLPVGPLAEPLELSTAAMPQIQSDPPVPVGPVEVERIEVVDGSQSRTPDPTRFPTRRSPWVIFTALVGGAAVAILLIILVIGDGLLAADAIFPGLRDVYMASVVVAVVALAIAASNSWRKYHRLHVISALQEWELRTHQGIDGKEEKEGWKVFSEYLDMLKRTHPSKRQRIQAFENKCERNLRGDLALFERDVLRKLDEEADRFIVERAIRVGIATSLAGRLWEPIIVIWHAIHLTTEVATVYAGRPGMWGTLRILFEGLATAVLAEVWQVFADSLSQVVAQGISARLSARLGEGIGNAALFVRLGCSVKQFCRAVPPDGSGLAAIWKTVFGELKRVFREGFVEPEATAQTM